MNKRDQGNLLEDQPEYDLQDKSIDRSFMNRMHESFDITL
jgi:hypothetical protein